MSIFKKIVWRRLRDRAIDKQIKLMRYKGCLMVAKAGSQEIQIFAKRIEKTKKEIERLNEKMERLVA